MIIDSLQNLKNYVSMNSRLKLVVDFFEKHDYSKFDEAYYELDGKNVFVKITDNALKTKEDAKLESHRRYFDIQVPLIDHEKYGWKSVADCKSPASDFNIEKDIVFYTDQPDMYFTLQAGQFAIFFPDDAHAPLVGDGTIKKMVVKVLID